MPIGFPVDNTSVYLFDNDMRPAGLEKVSPFDEWMLPTSFTVTDVTRAGFVSQISSARTMIYLYFDHKVGALYIAGKNLAEG